jgi:hypothetical protein
MDELQRRGGKLLYDPAFIVHRRPRRTLQAFAKMLMTYGRGRAEQFRLHPTFGSALNFIPPLFCIYVLATPLVAALTLARGAECQRDAFFLPLLAYLLAVLAQSAVLIPRGSLAGALGAAPLIVLTHLLYGLGFWRGLFTRMRGTVPDRSSEVVIEIVPP